MSRTRVLLTCSLGGAGHLTPVIAIARAIVRLGHEPTILVPPALADEAGRAGVPYTVGGEPPRAEVEAIWARMRAGPREAVTGLIDRELFADRAARAMLGPARALRDAWRPDVIIREPCEYASAIVADEAAIPQIQIAISQADVEWRVLELVTAILVGHRPEVVRAIRSAPYLTPFPASLDPSPWPDTRRFRAAQPPARPRPADRADSRPLVYVTFGSVLGHLPEAAAVFRTALAAVADLPARVLLTVGRATDSARLGPIPANVRVEGWVAQAEVLPHAALVVCHGGSGTTFGALAAGVPLVVCPLFADQAANARLIETAGAGVVTRSDAPASGGLRALGPADVAPLRAAIEHALGEPDYRRAAERIAGEMAAMPTIDDVLAALIT